MCLAGFYPRLVDKRTINARAVTNWSYRECAAISHSTATISTYVSGTPMHANE